MEVSLHSDLLVSLSYITSLTLCASIGVDSCDIREVSTRTKSVVYHLPHILRLLVVRVWAVNGSFRNRRIASQRLVSNFFQTTSSDVFFASIIDLSNLVRHVNAIFLEFLNAIESFFLKQLIHAVESLIVFMESRRLLPS